MDSSYLMVRGVLVKSQSGIFYPWKKANISFEFQLIGDGEFYQSLFKCDGLQFLTLQSMEETSFRPKPTVREFKE